MFGNKQDKQARLEQEMLLLSKESLSQAELARRLGVDRATILKDIVILEEKGIYLYEDDNGKLYLHKWW